MVAIKQDTTVQPGGVIQIRSDQLPEGARAQVIVLLETSTSSGSGLNNTPRPLGLFKGKMWMAPDFNKELPENFWCPPDDPLTK
jgi:hypothetical protein